MKVKLEAKPNPDYTTACHQADVNIKATWKQVGSFAEASSVVRNFIDTNELGAGNFTGGEIRDDELKAAFAWVSYNGKAWDCSPADWMSETAKVIYDPSKAAEQANPSEPKQFNPDEHPVNWDGPTEALEIENTMLRVALEETTDRYERLEAVYAQATGITYDGPNGTIARNRKLLAPEQPAQPVRPDQIGSFWKCGKCGYMESTARRNCTNCSAHATLADHAQPETKTINAILREQGYCCCGADKNDGEPTIATLCPKHGATALMSGAGLEYRLNDEQAADHFAATGCSCRQRAGDNRNCEVHRVAHLYELTDGKTVDHREWLTMDELKKKQAECLAACDGVWSWSPVNELSKAQTK